MTVEKPAAKKRVNSKSKGSSFEGQVAKRLSTALDPLKFIRSQGSGARVGGKNFATIGQLFGEDALKLFVGDVVASNEKDVLKDGSSFRWSIETKFYKTPDSFPGLIAGSANVFKWMEESIDDSQKVARSPLLIFKWNHTPTYAAVLSEDVGDLVPKLTIAQGKRTLCIFLLDDLLGERTFWFTFAAK